jgi:hypothetical protein
VSSFQACPHCGGALLVLVDADAVDTVVLAREALSDAVTVRIAAWAKAEQAMIEGVAVVKAP